jgi:hypothetical protein
LLKFEKYIQNGKEKAENMKRKNQRKEKKKQTDIKPTKREKEPKTQKNRKPTQLGRGPLAPRTRAGVNLPRSWAGNRFFLYSDAGHFLKEELKWLKCTAKRKRYSLSSGWVDGFI